MQEIKVPCKYMICHIRQLCKGQDYAVVEENIDLDGNAFDGLALFDGHGSDRCINLIRKMPLTEIMKKNNSMKELNLHLCANFKNLTGSGSTCILTKVYSDHILIDYVGDSQVAVFIDKKCVYLSVPHNLENPEEYERVKPILRKIEPIEITKKPTLVSTTRIGMIQGNRCYFQNGCHIALTQALGHNGETGFSPNSKRIDFHPHQHVRIISATDGFWEMMYLEDPKEIEDLISLSPEALVDKAHSRWKQEWIFSEDKDEQDESKFQKTDFGGIYDDIALAFWDNKYSL